MNGSLAWNFRNHFFLKNTQKHEFTLKNIRNMCALNFDRQNILRHIFNSMENDLSLVEFRFQQFHWVRLSSIGGRSGRIILRMLRQYNWPKLIKYWVSMWTLLKIIPYLIDTIYQLKWFHNWFNFHWTENELSMFFRWKNVVRSKWREPLMTNYNRQVLLIFGSKKKKHNENQMRRPSLNTCWIDVMEIDRVIEKAVLFRAKHNTSTFNTHIHANML